MPISKEDVLEVLGDLRLRNLRISVGPIQINSTEYDKVADYIKSGAIAVKHKGGNFSMYYPEINTLKTRDGDPRTNLNVRTNLLHECTHIISDMNKVKISRLDDEAAAYLAQIAYLLLLDPTTPEPPIGPPLNNMMRLGMQLVRKYRIGKPEGIGAVIDRSDVSSLAQSVRAIPDYSKIGPNEMLAADGIDLSKGEAEEFYRLQLSRLASKMLDDLMAEEVAQLVTMSSRSVAKENYTTWDPELLELFDIYKCGPDKKKKAALQKLVRIFLTIDQRAATALLPRLLASKKGDIVSERFHREIPAQLKNELVAALRLSR